MPRPRLTLNRRVGALLAGGEADRRDAELLEPIAQAAEGDAEEPRRLLAHAAGLLQRPQDDVALVIGEQAIELDALERELDRGYAGGAAPAELGQRAPLDDRRGLERHRAL